MSLCGNRKKRLRALNLCEEDDLTESKILDSVVRIGKLRGSLESGECVHRGRCRMRFVKRIWNCYSSLYFSLSLSLRIYIYIYIHIFLIYNICIITYNVHLHLHTA